MAIKEETQKEKVIRKPDPSISKRKNINVATLNKIKSFLQEQIEPVFKSEIVKQLSVDYNSLNMALTMIKYETDDQGRIYLKKKGGKNV
jgi:hypothetical protein